MCYFMLYKGKTINVLSSFINVLIKIKCLRLNYIKSELWRKDGIRLLVNEIYKNPNAFIQNIFKRVLIYKCADDLNLS